MKGYLFSFIGLLLLAVVTDHSSCQQQSQGSTSATTSTTASSKKGIFPLAVGNYWVYRDSTFNDGAFASSSTDTVRISKESNWNGRKTFVFNDGREWYASGDTVYQLHMQRTQVKTSSPALLLTDKESTFNYVMGGDVVIQKTVSRLSACPSSKWNSGTCYKYSDNCGGYTIVNTGVGVLREKIAQCPAGSGEYRTRTLTDVHIN